MSSSWYKMKRVIATVLRYKKLLKKIHIGKNQGKMIDSSLLKEAELDIIKMVQARKFAAEIKSLRTRDWNSDGESRPKISQLDPFLDDNGVLYVGGK